MKGKKLLASFTTVYIKHFANIFDEYIIHYIVDAIHWTAVSCNAYYASEKHFFFFF